MTRYFLTAMGAGIVSALLYLSTGTGSVWSFLFLWAAPLPLFIAGLSAGAASVLIAALAGAFLMALLTNFQGALFYGLFLGLPAAWLVRLALLSRPRAPAENTGEDDEREWYPPGHLLAWIGAISAAYLGALAVMYWGQGGLRSVFSQMLAPVLENPQLRQALTEQGVNAEQFAQTLPVLAPMMAGIFWLLILASTLYLGQLLARQSGLAIRPTPLIQDMELPLGLLTGLGLALGLSFLDGRIGFLASSAAAVLAFPYFLLGLAVVHAISRAWPGRVWLLAAMYFFIINLILPFFILWGIGLLEPWLGLRKKFP